MGDVVFLNRTWFHMYENILFVLEMHPHFVMVTAMKFK